jgi:hypothetical protein
MCSTTRLMLFFDGRYPRRAWPVLAEYIRPNVYPAAPSSPRSPLGTRCRRRAEIPGRVIARIACPGGSPQRRLGLPGAPMRDWRGPPHSFSRSREQREGVKNFGVTRTVGCLFRSRPKASMFSSDWIVTVTMIVGGMTKNLSQNRLKRITRQASWTKPRKLWAWYSQRTRMRRCH